MYASQFRRRYPKPYIIFKVIKLKLIKFEYSINFSRTRIHKSSAKSKYEGLNHPLKALAQRDFHFATVSFFLAKVICQNTRAKKRVGAFLYSLFLLDEAFIVLFHFQNSQEAIQRATDYLEKQFMNLNRPYSMALTAYALSLVNSEFKIRANDRLVQKALYDNGILRKLKL